MTAKKAAPKKAEAPKEDTAKPASFTPEEGLAARNKTMEPEG